MYQKSVFISALVASVLLSGCQGALNRSDEISRKNVVKAGDPETHRVIGDEKSEFTVLGAKRFQELTNGKAILKPDSKIARKALDSLAKVSVSVPTFTFQADESSLVFGLPVGLLGQQNFFGAVITKVSATKDERLGVLKLTDLPSLLVRPLLAKSETGQYFVTLLGCPWDCTEGAEQVPLINLPVVGVDQSLQTLILDLTALGAELDLVGMLDPMGSYTGLKTKYSKAIAFDYSLSTLVFDIESHMIPIFEDPSDPAVEETVITTRWYLKLTSSMSQEFTPRAPTEGVGYFTTERGVETRITRFSLTDYGQAPVKYYVKNVPAEFQPAFAGAFDSWNETFKPLIGKALVQYEFINADDPRNELLVAGDVRYNILEWDLVNAAPYGGLGPNIANQATGEIISANVLIQGPTIVSLYSTWFKVNEKAEALRSVGKTAEADQLLIQTRREITARIQSLQAPKLELNLGKKLKFRVTGQLPSLQDSIMQRMDFEEVPAGMTYLQYMDGYFREMVAHELGHNIGLRHNFRGNLGAAEVKAEGNVSRSIMEYMGRGFRYLNRINDYDVMAVAYGYKGEKPKHLDWYCTDENVPDVGNLNGSAECSRDDATADPYGFFVERLDHAIDLLLNRGSAEAPNWTVSEMPELGVAVKGLALYAATAEKSAASWTNFFGGNDRPVTINGVKRFVKETLLERVCDTSYDQELASKKSQEAKLKAEKNLNDLKQNIAEISNMLGVLSIFEMTCADSALD